MKIWNEFGSSHSTNVTIIGEFKNHDDALLIKNMIEDLVLGCEQGISNAQEFGKKWRSKIPGEYIYMTKDEFNDDPDASVHIEINNKTLNIDVSKFNNFFGIIKIMFAFCAIKIELTGTPN
jgi:hypothetical protein